MPMLRNEELLRSHCRPLEGQSAMTLTAVDHQLVSLPSWTQRDGAIEREYRFADYHDTLSFVNALAYMVHREDHHPDLRVGYNRVDVRFNTHSVGGISLNDFICAAKADAIFEQRFGT
jgi:4a-hydroxytetrahydrobiopterin dehydratase